MNIIQAEALNQNVSFSSQISRAFMKLDNRYESLTLLSPLTNLLPYYARHVHVPVIPNLRQTLIYEAVR